MRDIEVRVHRDLHEFWAIAKPFWVLDPIRHTVPLTVIRRLVEVPSPDDAPPILLTLWEGATLCGVACRTPPWLLIASGIPDDGADSVVSTLLQVDPDLPGVAGPRDAAERVAAAWSKQTGAAVREAQAMRLYRLGTLVPPAARGGVRHATAQDVPRLAAWTREFEIEATSRERPFEEAESNVRRAMELGYGSLLWEIDGTVASWARASSPIYGMSRVGPVYTPPELRGRGYGAAVTAAASQWALDAGARDVVLYTDLSNPISNSIYQRIGYRPVFDAAELAFDATNVTDTTT